MNRDLSKAVWKRFLWILVLASVGLAAIVAALYVQDRRHERAITEQEGEHLVGLQSEIIIQEFEDVRADLLYLSDQHTLRQFLSGREEVRALLETDYARICLRKGVYDQVRCLDTAGKEVIRVNYRDGAAQVVPPEELQEKAGRYYYHQALDLNEGEVLVSPFDLNIEHAVLEQPLKPTIRFLTPAFDSSGVKRGFLVLNYLGDHLLEELAQTSRRARGTSLLLNARGDYLLAARPEDAWGWMRGHGRAFRSDYPLAWSRIRPTGEGQFFTPEGLFTFRRTNPFGPRRSPVGAAKPEATTAAEGESIDPSLVVVSRVSADGVYVRSSKLLAQLVLMYGGASIVVAALAWHGAKAAALRRAHEEQIAESELRLRKLSSQLLTTQEEERRSISRQLHDELGQLATAVHLDLKSAARQTDRQRGQDLVRRAIEGTEQLLKNLHAIATRVRPTVLDDLGLHDAVESYLEEFSHRTGIAVAADLSFPREHIPADASEHAYRILQEALTNVAKHAQTSQVSVVVHVGARQIELSVRDEGVGFAPERHVHTRLGILGMQERAELLGGAMQLISAPGEGTRVEVTIPFSAA